MMNIISAHEIFSALDQEYYSKKWIGHDPLLCRQMRLSQEIMVVFAVRKENGRHIVYVQCDPDDVAKGYQYPAWKGIAIDFSGFDNVDMKGCYIRIEQSEESDDEVYFAVSDDLCCSLKDIKIADLHKHLTLALERWKRFFSLRDSLRLTREEQIGLFGELYLLRNMLQNDIGIGAIGCWRGPYNEVFDFSLRNMGVEVKTTTAKMPYKAHINNEMQLNNYLAGGTLVLCFIAVQPSDFSGETIGDVVKCIEKYAERDKVAYSLFRDKVFGCGLGNLFIESYSTKYIVKECAFFNVKEGFPRIIGENLAKGIGDITYSIEISACSNYRLEEQEFLQITKLHTKEEIA